jgi:pyruvate dehydrogenase (quinone)
MATTVGDLLLRSLDQWGVRRNFGRPDDGINGIMNALGRQDRKFIQARHQDPAAFMACAHAKFTGEPGVRELLAADRPCLLEIVTGPNVPRSNRRPQDRRPKTEAPAYFRLEESS